jgi:hypothetical protein
VTVHLAPPRDWNAADVEKGLPKAGLLGRLGLSAKRTAKRALRDSGARPLREGEFPRFTNIVEGLAGTLHTGAVDTYVIEGGGPNAFVCRIERPALALRVSLLETYTRTELEAVIAHCLVRSDTAGRKGSRVGFADDVRAAALTRYPPALAAALRKADPYRGRFPGYYLVADAPTHRPVEERAVALLDL